MGANSAEALIPMMLQLQKKKKKGVKISKERKLKSCYRIGSFCKNLYDTALVDFFK